MSHVEHAHSDAGGGHGNTPRAKENVFDLLIRWCPGDPLVFFRQLFVRCRTFLRIRYSYSELPLGGFRTRTRCEAFVWHFFKDLRTCGFFCRYRLSRSLLESSSHVYRGMTFSYEIFFWDFLLRLSEIFLLRLIHEIFLRKFLTIFSRDVFVLYLLMRSSHVFFSMSWPTTLLVLAADVPQCGLHGLTCAEWLTWQLGYCGSLLRSSPPLSVTLLFLPLWLGM